MDKQRIVGLDASHQASVEALFETCFGTRSDEQWFFWKYASDARFDGKALGLFGKDRKVDSDRALDSDHPLDSDRLLAHYAGFPRALQLPCTQSSAAIVEIGALQIGDVMVDPIARHGIARNNQFAKLTRHFFSSTLNALCPIAFGFPNQRHLRQGIMAGLYSSIGKIYEIEWRLERSSNFKYSFSDFPYEAFECKAQDVDRHHFDQLAELVASSRAQWAIVRRNLAYWQWRFPPSRGYRWIRSERGFAILRKDNEQGFMWHLLDWLCLPDDAEALLKCCIYFMIDERQSAKIMPTDGQICLKTWASRACAEELRRIPMPRTSDMRVEVIRRATDVELALNCVPKHEYSDLVNERFWVISGDTDFL